MTNYVSTVCLYRQLYELNGIKHAGSSQSQIAVFSVNLFRGVFT
jgi:hypothetical protein